MCAALVLFLPSPSSGQEKNNYLAVKAGFYTFNDRLRDADIRTGFEGGVAFGHYLHRNIVLEEEIGYFHDGVNKSFGNDITGIPFLLTLKGVYPFRSAEIFIGGGIGIYSVRFHGMVNGFIHGAAGDIVFGQHVVAGGTLNVFRSLFIGVEGKYIFTGTADFDEYRSRLDGYTASALLGYRF
jgi:hypothetical protein